jgi:Lon protease-like protein
MADPRRLAMFPLGTVLFPYAMLPLHVFETRYRIMVRECLRADQGFGVVLIERGSEVGGGDTRFRTGTIARIVQAAELPDGRYALSTVGTRRIHVERWLPDDPYPQAEVVDAVDAPLDADAHTQALEARTRVDATLRRLLALWSTFDARVSEIVVALDDDPARAVFEAAALTPLGPLDAQRVLEAGGTLERYARLEAMLADEIALLEARGREP